MRNNRPTASRSKIAGSRRTKTMGGKSTATWMSYPFFIHSNSLSLAWRAWLTPIGQGGSWSIPTCNVGQRKSSDPIRDDGHNQSEPPPEGLVDYPSGYSPVRTAGRATNLRAHLQHGRKTLKASVDCPRV